MGAMRIPAKLAIAIVGGICLASAQDVHESKAGPQAISTKEASESDRSLSQDDRLSLLAAALDSKVRLVSKRDCSHLVHAIYQRAGFPYAYAPSSDLYAGAAEGFQRVKQPQPGDLVVWKGHVGIVIKPSQHVFFSFMSSGPGTDDYGAPYWKGRGRPRFYHYLKSDSCGGCDSSGVRSRRLVKVRR
jgi:cell wall-associated NlpC family hydrolase